MKLKLATVLFSCGLLIGMFGFFLANPVNAQGLYQIPTGVIPTVTSTPSGVTITVRLDQDQINVRSGPGTSYEKVGVLIAGQQAPAKGRSVAGEWLLIEYPGITGGLGWVYAPLVGITPGNLPIVEPPPTPTPLYTTTIDPTLAAQFIVTAAPTRLPTYTEAAPITIPTFEDKSRAQFIPGGVPLGLIILSLASVGVFIGLFTIAQGR
jgi:hypothetical protein